jgi:prefoldin alpha subunit
MAENNAEKPKHSEQELKGLQRAYMEMQTLDMQMRQLSQQSEVFDQQIAEIHDVSQSVAELGAVKAGTQLCVPIASGIFIRGKMESAAEMLVSVGAGTVVPASVERVRAMLEEQVARLRKNKEGVTRQLEALSKRSAVIEATLRKMVEG